MAASRERPYEEHFELIDRNRSTHTRDFAELGKTITVDVKRNDEAVQVLVNYAGDQSWSHEEEIKLLRKIDFRVLPILCLTYGLQYYDKAMLSQAVRDCIRLCIS